jgi:hypothetical protein
MNGMILGSKYQRNWNVLKLEVVERDEEQGLRHLTHYHERVVRVCESWLTLPVVGCVLMERLS